MNKNTTLLALILMLTGCMAGVDKGPAPDLTAGKADGTVEVVDNGPLSFGEDVGSDVREGLAHEWTFSLDATADVTFETSAGPEGGTDTILYVFAGEDTVDVNDDGGPGLFSKLQLTLEAGDYRVAVGGYGASEGDFTLTSACAGEGCGGEPVEPVEPADPWAMARDVHTMHVEFTDETPIPEFFSRAEGISPISLSSPEWWQRWSGGATQSFSWDEGTDYGKRCGQASAIRLQAIVEYEETDADGVVTRPGQEAFDALREGSGWRGTMYNWTEDVSEGGRPAFSPASMWAWRTGAIKWINVVRPDGSCDLPTLDLVQRFSDRCLQQAAREDGEIQGCRVSGR